MIIRLTGFKKQYGDAVILAVPALQLGNPIYWLKGVNGSGKSTLLKSLAGIIPFDGTIHMDNIDVVKQPMQHRQLVNYAEAEPVFPDFLTGFDLAKLFASTKSGSISEAIQMSEQLQLGAAIKNKTGSYSSGMLKKLSLILAFTGKPKLILLDEPFITLDQQAVTTVIDLIQQRVEQNIQFIITSHQDVDLPENKLPVTVLYIKNNSIVTAQ